VEREHEVAKWSLASSTGRGRDKDGWRGARGRREAGGGRPADSVSMRWRIVADPSWHGCVCACALAGHAAMGRRGPLARGPYRLNSF
jgi:hypothetical protein